MYIPDDIWDQMINRTSDMVKYLDNKFLVEPSDPESIKFSECRWILHGYLNLNDSPWPSIRKPRLKKKGFHKIREGREYLRKFTKHFISRLAADRINKIKKRKRKSTNSAKSAKVV